MEKMYILIIYRGEHFLLYAMFSVMGRLVMGCLVMGCLAMGRLVMGHLVMGRFVCESLG